MTDQIKVKPAASGLQIALREAQEPNGDEARYVQAVDVCSRALELATIRSVTVADGVDISDLSDFDDPVVMGDKTLVIVAPFHTLSNGVCRLTPIVKCGADYMLLETKESGVGDALFNDGSLYPSPVLVWDVLGADTVYMHITHNTIGGGNTLTLKAGVI